MLGFPGFDFETWETTNLDRIKQNHPD